MLKFKRSTQANASSHQLPINSILGSTSITNIRLTELTAAWLAPLRERRCAELKLTPAGPTTGIFKKTGKNRYHPGCGLTSWMFTICKKLPENPVGNGKWNLTYRVVLEANFREQGNV